MRAIVITEHGRPEVFAIRELPDPTPGDGFFPITDVPLQGLIDKAEQGAFNAEPARVFAFEEVAEAHRLMETGAAGGKLVVSVD